MVIASNRHIVESISSELLKSIEAYAPVNMDTGIYSDFQVEIGFLSTVENSLVLDNVAQAVTKHIEDLIRTAASLFDRTDSAITDEVLRGI